MTENVSDSELSHQSHSNTANTEIYCDEFLGTSVVFPDRDLFMHAAHQLMDNHAVCRQQSGMSKFLASPHHHSGSLQGLGGRASVPQHKYELKADVLRLVIHLSVHKL
jgi:hypothetical protein